MTQRNDGGPAYPVPGLQNDESFNGMSLRDAAALASLQGLLANPRGSGSPDFLAALAYEHADAFIAARERS